MDFITYLILPQFLVERPASRNFGTHSLIVERLRSQFRYSAFDYRLRYPTTTYHTGIVTQTVHSILRKRRKHLTTSSA